MSVPRLEPIPFPPPVHTLPNGEQVNMTLRAAVEHIWLCCKANAGSTTIVALAPCVRRTPSAGQSLHDRILALSSMAPEQHVANIHSTLLYFMRMCSHVIHNMPKCNLWSDMNSQLLRAALMGMVPHVIGQKVWDQYTEVTLRMLQLPVRCRVLARLPRQIGKSVSAAIATASAIAGASGHVVHGSAQRMLKISLCAQANTTAAAMLLLIGQIVSEMKASGGAKLDVRCCDSERLTVVNEYSSNERKIRGPPCDILVLDEAAFVPAATMEHSVIMMQDRERTGLWMSTPGNDARSTHSRFDQLVSKPDGAGMPGAIVMSWALVCRECRESGRASHCEHGLSLIPDHREIHSIVWQIQNAGSVAQADHLRTELLGCAPASGGALIPSTMTDVLFLHRGTCFAHLRPADLVDQLIVTVVDPAFGSSRSAQAMVTYAFTEYGDFVILAMDCTCTSHVSVSDQACVLTDHIKSLVETYPDLCSGHLTYMALVEANGSHAMAMDIVNTLMTCAAAHGFRVHPWFGSGRIQELVGSPTLSPGLFSTQPPSRDAFGPVKRDGVDLFLTLWRLGRFAVSSTLAGSRIIHFDTTHGFGAMRCDLQPARLPQAEWLSHCVRTLAEQLTQLERVGNDDISGKGPSKREKDDLATTVLLALALNQMIRQRAAAVHGDR